MSIEIKGMAPLIQVFDMHRSLEFYRDKLGFEITGDSGGGDDSDWVMLRKGDATIMLNGQYESDQRPEAPPPERQQWHKDTCIFFGCPDVDAVFVFLQSKGIEAERPKIAPYGMKQLYLTDPDGYGICFQWPASREFEETFY